MSEKYRNPSITVDTVIFTVKQSKLNVLLIQRKAPPYQDNWAIPGGFVDYEEDIYIAAKRELEEETGLNNIEPEQLITFGQPDRDPRGRVISVVYYTIVNSENLILNAQSDAKDAKWFNVKNLPELAFDHCKILEVALDSLKKKLENTSFISNILPEQFSIQELFDIYELIFDRKLDFEQFKQEISKFSFLEKISENIYQYKKNENFSSRFQ